MKDFLGNDLRLGDVVAFTEPNYRNLVKGKVIAFTPKNVRVEYTTWGSPSVKTYLSAPGFVILAERGEMPDVCNTSHKSLRSSMSSHYDMICDDCGKTDAGSGVWGELRNPCK